MLTYKTLRQQQQERMVQACICFLSETNVQHWASDDSIFSLKMVHICQLLGRTKVSIKFRL